MIVEDFDKANAWVAIANSWLRYLEVMGMQ
jgi:hypothetical protein